MPMKLSTHTGFKLLCLEDLLSGRTGTINAGMTMALHRHVRHALFMLLMLLVLLGMTRSWSWVAGRLGRKMLLLRLKLRLLLALHVGTHVLSLRSIHHHWSCQVKKFHTTLITSISKQQKPHHDPRKHTVH
jgi:hypothetical protein